MIEEDQHRLCDELRVYDFWPGKPEGTRREYKNASMWQYTFVPESFTNGVDSWYHNLR